MHQNSSQARQGLGRKQSTGNRQSLQNMIADKKAFRQSVPKGKKVGLIGLVDDAKDEPTTAALKGQPTIVQTQQGRKTSSRQRQSISVATKQADYQQPRIKLFTEAPPSKSQANALTYAKQMQEKRDGKSYQPQVVEIQIHREQRNELIPFQYISAIPNHNEQHEPETSYSLPVSAAFSPPSFQLAQRQSIGPDIGLMSSQNFVVSQFDHGDETMVRDEPTSRVQAVGLEASVATINAWGANAAKTAGFGNSEARQMKPAAGRKTLNGLHGSMTGLLSKPSFQAHKKASPRQDGRNLPSSVPISVNNSLVQHKVITLLPSSANQDTKSLAQLKSGFSVGRTTSMLQSSSQQVFQSHLSFQSLVNHQKPQVEHVGQQRNFFDQLRGKQTSAGKQTQKHTNRSFFENFGQMRPSLAQHNHETIESQIGSALKQSFGLQRVRDLQSEKCAKQGTTSQGPGLSAFQLEPQIPQQVNAPRLKGQALQRVKSPSWTQPNSPNGGKTGTSLKSKEEHASPDCLPPKKLKINSLMQGIDLRSQPSLSLSLQNATRQLVGESNDDVNGEDDEVVIGERSAIKTNAGISTALKSRNAKEIDSFNGGIPMKVSYTFQATLHEVNRSVDPLQPLAKLESEIEDDQRDDFSQEMGTILSESNEVTKQLMNADALPISSPARGKISQANPDFQKILQELQLMEMSEDENILEQTLGRTLTHQKQILQEINSQTSNRIIRDYQSPIELLLSAQPHERADFRRNRRIADSGLLSVSNSQILQENEPRSTLAKQSQISATNFQQSQGNKNSRLLKLTKLPVEQHKAMKQATDLNQTETQQAEFSDFEDSRALDEAIDATSKLPQAKSAAKEVHSSKTLKQKGNPASGTDARRLTAVVPHNSNQTKGSLLMDHPKPANKSFAIRHQDQANTKGTPEIPSLKDQIKNGVQGGKMQQELIMRLANLSTLSGSVFLLPNYKQLKLLDLRNNRLQDLPGEICTLNVLTTLKVDYNYLVALPFSLGNLAELQSLSASQNRLIELPDSLFRHDSKLHTLLVNDNKITRIQRSLGGLKHLRQLYLHSNNIVELPTSFCQLTKIHEFSLDWLAYIEKTQEELEEMQGIRQPVPENKEHLQTINDQPVSARKYFDSNANETQECLEETKLQLHRLQDDLGMTTQRNSARTPLLHKEATKLADNFSLSIIGNKKVLKGEKGLMVVKELRLLCKLIDNAQKSLPVKRQSNIEHGRLHFIQFLMYFQNLSKLSQVKDFVYRHKDRTFLHQMGLNGHVYLIQASIAVLGMKRPLTSFNINKTDEDNSTALVLALRQKRFDFVKYLLRLPQISTMIYSHKYGLPLHLALQQCEFKLALKLLKRQDQLKTPEESVELDVNVPNEQGNTAMHLVFMNFNHDPEMAALVAKILIRKGANLRAKNKNELGLLHVAVQAGTLKALKFAQEHNENARRRNRKPGQQSNEAGLFQFNMKAGNNNWTLLHYAIQATNLSTIVFLLDCNENIDLTARDSQGRRAIDLCPFSSPIFKSIRAQIQRKTFQTIRGSEAPQNSQISDTDFTVPLQKRQVTTRDVIDQRLVFNEPRTSIQANKVDRQTGMLHKHQSARDCLISIGNKAQVNQMKSDPRLKGEGPQLNKAEPNIKKHFESVITNQTHNTIIFDDADPYDQSEMFNEQVNRKFPYKTIAQGSVVQTEQSRLQRLMGDFVYGAANATGQPNNFLSTSFVDSIEDKGFELYNSQAAAFPFTLIEEEKSSTNPRYSQLLDMKDKSSSQLHETATFIQNQPLNVSTESHKQFLRESQAEIDEEVDDIELQRNDINDEDGNGHDSENGENVDDENDHLGSKAFEARVSQWNRQQSTQHMEEKKIHQQKLTLAQQIVNAFEDIRTQRAESEDLPATPEVVIKGNEQNQQLKQHIGLVIEEQTFESESDTQDAFLRDGSRSERGKSDKKGTDLQLPSVTNSVCFWQLESDFQVYSLAFRLDFHSLHSQYQKFAQLDASRISMNSGMLLLSLNEIKQLLLWRENEAQEVQMKKLIVINSTGRHRKSPTDCHQPGIANYLQRIKSQSSLQISQAGRRPQLPLMSSPQVALMPNERSPDNREELPAVVAKSSFYDVNFRRFQPKAYMEEDSMSMFESNNQGVLPVKLGRLEDQLKRFSSHRRNLSEFVSTQLEQDQSQL